MKTLLRLALCTALLLSLTNCLVISRGVTPATLSPDVHRISLVENPDVHMKGLHPEIVSQLTEMGYTVTTVKTPPTDGSVYMEYTANWRWDFAIYLYYFHADLKKNGAVLGSAQYSAKWGDMNPGKLGHTAEKIRPLLKQLMGKMPVQRH